MRNFLFLISLFAFSYLATFAQNNLPCPKIEIKEPTSVTMPGNSIIFSVSVIESEKNADLKYFWTTSDGKIIKGQETDSIEIATTKELNGINITATVEVNGLPENCINKFSAMGSVVQSFIREPSDRYGKLSFLDEQARIDSLIAQMEHDSEATAIIALEAKNKRQINFRIARIFQHFAYRKFPIANRIIFMFSIGKAEYTVLWLGYKNAELPECKDCKIIKGSEINLKLKKQNKLTR